MCRNHLDEHLSGLDVVLGANLDADLDVAEVAVDLPEGDVWTRLGRLYESSMTYARSE